MSNEALTERTVAVFPDSAPAGAGSWHRVVNGQLQASKYASHAISTHTLVTIRDLIGLSTYQFAKFLSLPQFSTIYRWLSGDSRPSQAYMVRVLHLLVLHTAGKLDIINFNGKAYWPAWEAEVERRIGAEKERKHGTISTARVR